LAERDFNANKIKIEEEIKKEDDYTSYFFSYHSEGGRVSGQLNLPDQGKDLPVLLMLRGYADKEIYFTGLGTRRAASFFARHDFVTLAPDFLGFGRSDPESEDILLNRFRRPVTVLELLSSIDDFNSSLEEGNFPVRINPEKVFIWGHSNGGQVALSVLEITGRSIPTTLWAPVSKPFPQSVLQYASELEDEGKLVIEAIDEFKKNYQPSKFSIVNYLELIRAPLQIHQGTDDFYVDVEDTNKLVKNLNKMYKKVYYYTYEGDDHNLKNNWEQVVERDLGFFAKYL
jgi:dipeptidyl aminopeptidase/acylaminoacyl peptidase